MSDCIVVYLNEQKVTSLSCAAVLADEHVYKTAFVSQPVAVATERKSSALGSTSGPQPIKPSNPQEGERKLDKFVTQA